MGRPAEGVGPEDLLTTEQAASALGVNPATVRSWAQAGRLPGRRWGTGNAWHFRRADVDAFLHDCRVRPGTLGHLYDR